MDTLIRFEVFQAVSFVLAGSMFFYFALRLIEYAVRRLKDDKVR